MHTRVHTAHAQWTTHCICMDQPAVPGAMSEYWRPGAYINYALQMKQCIVSALRKHQCVSIDSLTDLAHHSLCKPPSGDHRTAACLVQLIPVSKLITMKFARALAAVVLPYAWVALIAATEASPMRILLGAILAPEFIVLTQH